MVMVKILGILEEDTFMEYGALKLGETKELMAIEGKEFIEGSVYDGVLLRKGLLDYARNLVNLMIERTEEFGLDGSVSISLEDMSTNKFIMESGTNDNCDVVEVTLAELNVYDSYVTVNGGTFINGVVKGEDNLEVEVYFNENVAVRLPDTECEDVSLIDSLVDRAKLEEKTSSKVAFNSFAVGLGMTCARTSKNKEEALEELEKAYVLAKGVINELCR